MSINLDNLKQHLGDFDAWLRIVILNYNYEKTGMSMERYIETYLKWLSLAETPEVVRVKE